MVMLLQTGPSVRQAFSSDVKKLCIKKMGLKGCSGLVVGLMVQCT